MDGDNYYYEVEHKKKKYDDRFYGPGLERSLARIKDKESLRYKIWAEVLKHLKKEMANEHQTD